MDFLNEDGTLSKKKVTGVAFTSSTSTISPEQEIKHQSELQNKYFEQLLASKWCQIGKRNMLIKRINSCEKRILAMTSIINNNR